MNSTDYMNLLDGIKARVRSARLRAAAAVNSELVLLYWHIGRDILHRQTEQGWGAKVVDRLSGDLMPTGDGGSAGVAIIKSLGSLIYFR